VKKLFPWILLLTVVVSLLLVWMFWPKPPILVGFLGTMSGRLSDLGISNRRGVEFAVAEVNARGGIQGRQIQLVSLDDANDPELVHSQFAKLVAQRVVAVLGPVTSTMASEVIPLANKQQVLVMGTTVSSNALSGLDDFFLRVTPPNRAIVEELVQLLLKRNVKRVCVVADSSNPTYSVDWLSQFSELFARFGGQVQRSSFFLSGEENSLETAVEEVMAEEPSSVMVLGGAIDSALICQEVRQRNDSVFLVGTGWAFKPEFLEYGGKTVEGFLLNGNMDPGHSSEGYLRVARDFRERYGVQLDFASKAGYDAAGILFFALEKTRDLSASSLKKAILEEKVFEGLQQQISLDTFGDPDFPPMFFQVQNGQFVRLDTREAQ